MSLTLAMPGLFRIIASVIFNPCFPSLSLSLSLSFESETQIFNGGAKRAKSEFDQQRGVYGSNGGAGRTGIIYNNCLPN